MNQIFFLSLALFLISPSAEANLKPGSLQGQVVSHDVPGKRPELCVLPPKLEMAKYAKKDATREAELCGYNIDVNVAGCPKLNSTNPGVNFLRPKGGSGPLSCSGDQSLRAKYKLSTSCSYTPAILAYYHFSRALGNVLNVPTAVARTMDLERHQRIADSAIEQLQNKSGDLIYKTWSGLRSALYAGRSSRSAALLFTEDFTQSFGALSWNPKGEVFYKEFFNGGTDRAATFKQKNPIYRALIDPATRIGREFNSSNMQAMQQLKDLSDMLVLDTVLGQQDRFGNIHYETRYYFPETEPGGFKISSESDFNEVPAPLRAKAVAAKEMVLKDNDCGVAKDNRIKAAKLLDQVAHMDPDTYRRLQLLAQQGEGNREFFQRVLLFTDSDYRKVMGNLKEAAGMLKKACEAGKLKLDLDIDLHFSGAELPTRYRCEI